MDNGHGSTYMSAEGHIGDVTEYIQVAIFMTSQNVFPGMDFRRHQQLDMV